VLRELAQGLGLDMGKYDACMDSDMHRAQIQANLAEGERRNVNSTPTFVIGNRMIPGALYYDQFKQLIDEELAKLPARTDSAASAKTGDSATTGTPRKVAHFDVCTVSHEPTAHASVPM
jgi:predicted DsbA family dithiol-disulfide isomerase